MFTLLNDDLLVAIAEHLLHTLPSARSGLVLIEELTRTARAVYAVATTCRYTMQVLERSGLHVLCEAACRRATRIVPCYGWSVPTPVVCQFEAECTTKRLVCFLKQCVAALSLHCASNHCLSVRRNVNLHVGKKVQCRILVAHAAATRMAACYNARKAFLFCKHSTKTSSAGKGTVSRWLALVLVLCESNPRLRSILTPPRSC